MAKNKLINLLPQEEFEASNLGRALHWAMGSFRIIVIVTEMIVMGAFLSRFWLDAKNSDFSNSIKIASSQIQVQSQFEKKFRDLQTKLSIFKQITSGVKSSDRVKLISNKTPQGVTITSLTTHESTSDINGDADGEFRVAQFISNLRSDPNIKRVDLGLLSTSENNQALMAFQITISY